MMPDKRSAFFISDRTGISAEMLGHSLLTQFDGVAFNEVTLPFVDTVDKARVAVALTIKPERLQQIRNERRPGSAYATLANCEFEVREAEALMRQEGIPFLDATSKSVEELATTILQEASLVRRVY